MIRGLDALSPQQQRLVAQWLPGAVVERDHSWGQVRTSVLRVRHAGTRLVVKAGGEGDHHLEREIRGYLSWVHPWTSIGRAPELRHCDARAKLLVATWLPGRLVLGTHHSEEPDTYRQAGRLLALFHAQASRTDARYETLANRRALDWLDGPHRVPADVEGRLRREIAAWPTPAATLVPTHGDWQPRNWLVADGVVSVIDLGRAAMRPAMSDLARLAAQELRGRPDLEDAFLDGYGSDPREPRAWWRTRVREAIATAAWACRVGDEAFEAQGHRMIGEVLSDCAS